MTFLMGEERERRWQHTVRTDSHRLEGMEGGAVVQVPRSPAGFRVGCDVEAAIITDFVSMKTHSQL